MSEFEKLQQRVAQLEKQVETIMNDNYNTRLQQVIMNSTYSDPFERFGTYADAKLKICKQIVENSEYYAKWCEIHADSPGQIIMVGYGSDGMIDFWLD
jgi:hypothetical protein